MLLPRDMTAAAKHRWIASGIAALVGVLGVVMAHHPMIFSGLQRVQVSLIDSRFNNYVLEHCFLWSAGTLHHTEFWNPPLFYPAPNVAAYSDLLLSVAPVYMVIRACGLPPDTAFQLWMIALSGLNYALAYHILGRRFGLAAPAAAVAAFLFAFGAPRINQLGHPQLLPQFLSLVTIDALFGLFTGQGRPTPVWKRAILWQAAMLGVVTQVYAGFYLGWFLMLAPRYRRDCWPAGVPAPRNLPGHAVARRHYHRRDRANGRAAALAAVDPLSRGRAGVRPTGLSDGPTVPARLESPVLSRAR